MRYHCLNTLWHQKPQEKVLHARIKSNALLNCSFRVIYNSNHVHGFCGVLLHNWCILKRRVLKKMKIFRTCKSRMSSVKNIEENPRSPWKVRCVTCNGGRHHMLLNPCYWASWWTWWNEILFENKLFVI